MGLALARRARPILPFVYKSATVRRLIARRRVARRSTPADRTLEMIDEGIGL